MKEKILWIMKVITIKIINWHIYLAKYFKELNVVKCKGKPDALNPHFL